MDVDRDYPEGARQARISRRHISKSRRSSPPLALRSAAPPKPKGATYEHVEDPDSPPDEDELAADENPLLAKLIAAMNRRVPSEEDRKLLIALGARSASYARSEA